MAAPATVVEPMADAFLGQDRAQSEAFVPSVIPLAGAEDDVHVIELPRVGHVRKVLVGAVEIYVLIMIAVEEIADFRMCRSG